MKKNRKAISLLLTFVMLFSVLSSLSVASTSAVTHLPCLKQNDAQWKSYYYNTGNLYDTGCGIFSLVNAVGYLTGQRMSVTEVASWAHSINAFNVTGDEGTYRTVLYPKVEEKFGRVYGFTVDCDTAGTGYWEGSGSATLKNHLENGGVAVGHVPGHFIAVVGYDRSVNKFHVYDSYATNGRGTNSNGGDVWVTQSQFATGQLCLDWFCLLSATDKTESPIGSVSLPASYSPGTYLTTTNLNIHSSASASGDVLAAVPAGILVKVTKVSGVWGYTTYNGESGYIRLFYTTHIDDVAPPAENTVGVYKTTSNLNLRSSASANGTILTVIPSGTSLSVASISNGWGYTFYDGKFGYISMGYTTRTGDFSYENGVYQTTGDLNMRDIPSASGNLLATLPSGTTVSVTMVFGGWGAISYNGKNGYINLSYTKRTGDLPKETPYPVGVYETISDLNMRAVGSASGTIIATLPKSAAVFVTSVLENGWGYTSYNGSYGYINLKYATRTGDLPASAKCATGIYTIETDSIMHSASAYDSDSVTIIPANASFSVTKISSGWGYTKYNEYTGWMNLSNATFVRPLPTYADNKDSTGTANVPTELPKHSEASENVESITVTKLPDKKFAAGTEYDLGYCLHGMEIKVTYADGTDTTYTCERYDNFSSVFAFSGESIKYSMFMTPVLGENKITVSYGGKSTDFTITGLKVDNIDIRKPPVKTRFPIGQEYDIHNYLDGMEINVSYSDSTERTYTYENDFELFLYELEFSGEYFDEAADNIVAPDGENIIVVIHSGKWDVMMTWGSEVESIEITKLPDTIEFLTETEYSIYDYLYGMEVKVVYLDGTEKLYNYEDNQDFFRKEIAFSGACMNTYGNFIPDKGDNTIFVSYSGTLLEFIIYGVEIEDVPCLGDANMDGYVNIKDATAIQRHLADMEKLSRTALKAADFDGNGEVEINDATKIQKFIAEFYS